MKTYMKFKISYISNMKSTMEISILLFVKI